MAPKGGPGGRQQSEEDLLLQDFSRNLSAKSSALFFGNAFIVSAIPICERRGRPWEGGGGPGRGGAALEAGSGRPRGGAQALGRSRGYPQPVSGPCPAAGCGWGSPGCWGTPCPGPGRLRADPRRDYLGCLRAVLEPASKPVPLGTAGRALVLWFVKMDELLVEH